MCSFSAFATNLFSRISIINVSILATLRYLMVCRSKEFKLSTWLLILFLPNAGVTIFYSIGFYTIDASPSASYFYCNTFTNKSNISTILVSFIPFFYLIPCWIATYCYFMVGWIANKRLNLMKQEALNSSDEALLISIQKEKFRLWTQIMFVFVIYNANFGLSYTTWILKLVINYRRSTLVDAIICIQVYSTIFLNPIVTIIFQPDINNEFKFLWIKFKIRISILFKKISNQ
jgi:hypothetical protein